MIVNLRYFPLLFFPHRFVNGLFLASLLEFISLRILWVRLLQEDPLHTLQQARLLLSFLLPLELLQGLSGLFVLVSVRVVLDLTPVLMLTDLPE